MVDGTALEMRRRGNLFGGSNPSLSAKQSAGAATIPRPFEPCPTRRGFRALGIDMERVHLSPKKPLNPRFSLTAQE